jgi:hypothetical protein
MFNITAIYEGLLGDKSKSPFLKGGSFKPHVYRKRRFIKRVGVKFPHF